MKNNHEYFQKEFYNTKAKELPDSWRTNRNHKIKLQNALETLPEDSSGLKVLELGVGTGVHAAWTVKWQNGINYYGIDISLNLLRRCKKAMAEHRARFATASAEVLPFKDCSFDHVFIVTTLHHMENPLRCIKEATRVLKKGGSIGIVEPNRLNPWQLKQIVLNYAVEKNTWLMHRQNFLKWFHEAGLDIRIIEHIIYTPPIPSFFEKLYNDIDYIMAKIPLLNRLSIMLKVTGYKL